MPPKKKDKAKAILKNTESQATSKEPQSTPSKEKLLSSAMPIKSWIEMVEEQEAQYKAITSEDQVKEWMNSITNSPELMLVLQNISQTKALSQVSEREKPDFFKNDYVIKTEERDITLSKPFETINLFSEQSLKKLSGSDTSKDRDFERLIV